MFILKGPILQIHIEISDMEVYLMSTHKAFTFYPRNIQRILSEFFNMQIFFRYITIF